MKIPKTVECIQDVVMEETELVAFKKGGVYPLSLEPLNGVYLQAIDEQGEEHGLGHVRDLLNPGEFVSIYFTWEGK